jgi:preprotein translocase subunit YajC
MSLFISEAFAASGGAQTQDSMFSFAMIIAIFVIFYFMLIRPQNKRAKEQRNLLGGLQKGDEVVTNGGILGKIISIDDNYLKISIAETVEINLQRGAVSAVLPKGTIKSI